MLQLLQILLYYNMSIFDYYVSLYGGNSSYDPFYPLESMDSYMN